MKKIYESPELNKLTLVKEDILTASVDNLFDDPFEKKVS